MFARKKLRTWTSLITHKHSHLTSIFVTDPVEISLTATGFDIKPSNRHVIKRQPNDGIIIIITLVLIKTAIQERKHTHTQLFNVLCPITENLRGNPEG